MQALAGDPITIYGDGSQTRSFCYVSDLVDGWIKLMETPPAFTGPVNLGNPNEFTMIELARLVIELIGSSSKLEHHELPSDDPAQRKPDISLARNELAWEPTVQLREGLARTISYFKERFGSKGYGEARLLSAVS
jgi:UDP-glucuronate decarboxylase